MPKFFKLIMLTSLIAIGSTGFAQDATETEAQTQSDPLPLDMGQEVVDEMAPGTTYIREVFGAWELRCIRVEEGEKEPCQLFQLMKSETGSSIAEINILALPQGQQAAAGATLVTPLETLLTSQIRLAVDDSAGKRYPFTWCGTAGCYARIGFTNADIATLKRGENATLFVVPVFAPDKVIDANMSLAGFTKAYDALVADFAK